MTRTEIAVIVIAGGILLWDAKLAIDKKQGNTISELMRAWAKSNPIVPFLWGALMGHWWW